MKKFGVFELSFLSFKNKVNLIKNNTIVTFFYLFKTKNETIFKQRKRCLEIDMQIMSIRLTFKQYIEHRIQPSFKSAPSAL